MAILSRAAKTLITIVVPIVLMMVFAVNTFAQSKATKEINIALAKWGTVATASSDFNSLHSPQKAIDGKWFAKEDEISGIYKWNSKSDQDENWLILDFGQQRAIHKINIMHEGVFDAGELFNTASYELQYAKDPSGPWTNVVPPVVDNTEDITTHEFQPIKTRYLRLWITKADQKGNSYARIFEVEAFSYLKNTDILVAAEMYPAALRKTSSEEEVKFKIALYPTTSLGPLRNLKLVSEEMNKSLNKKNLVKIEGTNTSQMEVWVPLSQTKNELRIEGLVNGKKRLLRTIQAQNHKINNWGYLANGEVNIVCSSHNDIAWMDTPAKTAEFRDVDAITPALARMKNRDDVYFSMESVLYLEEYMERQPQNFDEVKRLTVAGNLDWGATYNQPYESLLSSEQLVRQMYLGAKNVRKLIPGAKARVAYSVDVPGRSLQMPQILSKSDVPYLLLSRHERGLFNWQSPDGSKVLCWSMEHYYDLHELGHAHDPNKFALLVNDKAKEWKPLYKKHNLPAVNGVLFSEDYVGPADFDHQITTINGTRELLLKNGIGQDSPYFPPYFQYSSTEQFFDKIAASEPSVKTIQGERPNVWLYIHGPSHHKAISAKRAAGISLPAAEGFSTINSVLEGSFENYPQERLTKAWAASIYDDHGWGGNNGEVTDSVFSAKLHFAKNEGKKILDNALIKITDKIDTRAKKGQPIVLYNALSWKRTDPVKVTVNASKPNFKLVDGNGNSIDYQIVENKGNNTYEVAFIAKDIPAFGYKTYYVTKKTAKVSHFNNAVTDTSYENNFYKLQFSGGGLRSLHDKQLGQELVDTNKFLAGEIFTMQSVGNGAGEFNDVQKPDMEGFDKVSLHDVTWKLKENGPIYARYELEQPIKHATVKQFIVVYHTLKRIDFDVELIDWDGTESREFRFALPLKMSHAKVTYEMPMGTVTIGDDEIDGAAGWMYTPEVKGVHPREVQNFISTNNGEVGVTLSSSVAVFDHVDPTDNPVENTIIQPILLASRKSCHWNGNWYLQNGSHTYSFSLFSHNAGWKNGHHKAIQANNPIIPVASERKKGELPSQHSFFSVSDPNIMVSAIKKSDDDTNVILRMYDIAGKDTPTVITTDFDITKAEHTNIIEENGTQIPFTTNSIKTTIGHHAIETFKVELKK